MRILALTEVPPYPPRNGITIPMHNHINILSKEHDVDILTAGSLSIVNAPYGEVSPMKIINRPFFKKLLGECLFGIPTFNLKVDASEIERFMVDKSPYDLIYYSAIRMNNVAENFADWHTVNCNFRPKIIAAVSDSYTSVLRSAPLAPTNSLSGWCAKWIRYFRSFYMTKIEFKILERAEVVLVQTFRDKEWMSLIGVSTSKISILTNAVPESLFQLPLNKTGSILFVGDLSSQHYQKIFLWFFESVWNDIKHSFPTIQLHAYTSGKKAEAIVELTNSCPRTHIVTEFVENIDDVYHGKTICIAPIFKDYGFINKVAEAMAAGLIVVGDPSAFNGIHGVKNEENCMIVNQRDGFAKTITELLSSKKLMLTISSNARTIAKDNFSWGHRELILKSILRGLE